MDLRRDCNALHDITDVVKDIIRKDLRKLKRNQSNTYTRVNCRYEGNNKLPSVVISYEWYENKKVDHDG